jgi:hypothetical protein
VGAVGGLYLSQVSVDHKYVTLTIGDTISQALATAAFTLVNAPDTVVFLDNYQRPAGVLISESARLGIFQSWGAGTFTFKPAQSEFAATVCFPTPEVGVRGLQLDDGTLFTGDVWLIGSAGVVFRSTDVALPDKFGQAAYTVKGVRMDVVGDPLFRRRLCTPTNLFNTPLLTKSIAVSQNGVAVFACGPDTNGDIKISANNNLATDTIMRVTTTPAGIEFSVVGALDAATAALD